MAYLPRKIRNPFFVALSLLLSDVSIGLATQAPIFQNLSHIRLSSGVNEIPDLSGDGRNGLIILGWRDNGNAHGYDVFLVMVPWTKGGGDWIVVRGPNGDVIRDQPHAGEDYVRSVRFVEGFYKGEERKLLLTVTRQIDHEAGSTYYTPSPANIKLFAIKRCDDLCVGTTPYYFDEIASYETETLYCNSEMATRNEVGLPLRPGYIGSKDPSGCFD